jgi:hypothetical protein
MVMVPIFRRQGTTYHGKAFYGYSREFQAYHEAHPISPGRGTTVGRSALEGRTVQIPDVLADPEYTFLEAQKLGQFRANLLSLIGLTKPGGGLDQRVEHGLQIERRAADDLEHVGGGGLLLEGFA